MRKILVVVMALAFIAGMAYAAEGKKSITEPVSMTAENAGAVVETAAQGVADTVNVEKNNPVTTAVESTAKVAEAGAKTATLQKVGKTSGKSGCSM